MIRTLLAATFGLLLWAAPLAAEEAKPAIDAERIAAAREMMEVTGVSKALDGITDAARQGAAQGANADKSAQGKQFSEEFDAAMKKFLSYKEEMLNDFAALYAENFTAAEMKEVTAFYKSGTGAKFIASMPALMQKGSEIGMKYSQKMMKELGAAKQ